MENKNKEILDTRFLARIVIEAETPLSVKSGDFDFYADSLVIRDVNGLPCIPGSSLAGVIRSGWKLAGKDDKVLFGFQGSGNEGMGSRVVISEARVLNAAGAVMDGLQENVWSDSLLSHYKRLPIRQHVHINERGVSERTGLFNEELVYAGTRFCFEMEFLGRQAEEKDFQQLMGILSDASFRLGGGTRKGFGQIKVVRIDYTVLPVNSERYLEKSSNLEESKEWYKKCQQRENTAYDITIGKWTEYCLSLKQDSLALFGAAYGDEESDIVPVKESRVYWSEEKGRLKEGFFLIPATSVKGALAHRVAFYYNKFTRRFADQLDASDMKKWIGTNNLAVRTLFGTAGTTDEKQQRGNVIISDLFIDQKVVTEKVLNHVAIDRFTGAPIEGALFTEKAMYIKDIPLNLVVRVNQDKVRELVERAYPNNKEESKRQLEGILSSLEKSLKELCNGLLPLGGGVNRGHGRFYGEMKGGRSNE